MLIVYLSLTGNIRRFIDKLDVESFEINPNDFSANIEINQEYIVIVPSYDDEITNIVSEFIDYKDNVKYLRGIVGSGERNFGEKYYIFNAKDLAKKYNSPLLFDFEKSGTEDDVEQFERKVLGIGISRTEQES